MHGRRPALDDRPVRSPVDVVDVKRSQRRERQRAAIGRGRETAHEARLYRTQPEAPRDPKLRTEGLLDFQLERDPRGLARRDVDAPDASVPGVQDGPPVRGEGVSGEQVAGESGLLLVALHRPGEPPVRAGVQVAKAQSRLRFVPRRVHEPRTVRGQERTHRAARGVGQRVLGALAQVPARDLPERQPQAIPEAPVLACVVEVSAVRGIDRSQRIGTLGHGHVAAGFRPGDPHAPAAVHVVRPDLERAEPPLRLGDDDMGPVGRPGGGSELGLGASAADLAELAAVRVGHPDRFAAVPVADEDDALAVGREARLRVERHAARDALRATALDGEGVEVADRLEDDAGPVRRHVERQPRDRVRLEPDRALALQREVRGRRAGRTGREEGGERPAAVSVPHRRPPGDARAARGTPAWRAAPAAVLPGRGCRSSRPGARPSPRRGCSAPPR